MTHFLYIKAWTFIQEVLNETLFCTNVKAFHNSQPSQERTPGGRLIMNSTVRRSFYKSGDEGIHTMYKQFMNLKNR